MSWKNELHTITYTIYKNNIPRNILTSSTQVHNSECIRLERFVRQGRPLSFPLYCTKNDVFTNSVNKDQNIKGFKLPGRKQNLKLSQYADDINFIFNNFSDIPFIFEQFSKYKKETGCTLNIDKTEGLLIQTNWVFYNNSRFPKNGT